MSHNNWSHITRYLVTSSRLILGILALAKSSISRFSGILDIIDGWSQSTGGGYVAGYFYSLNEHSDSGTDGSRSNEAEIFYMDSNPATLTTEGGRQGVLATTAHEFQHMIHWAHDVGEMTFVNEGLSEIAEHVCGYGVRSNGLYTQNTNVNLLSWELTGEVLDDYSRAAFWTLYIYEQFGVEILMDFVNNHHSDWTGLDATFRGQDANRGFWTVFNEWLIANYVNGNSTDTKYSYEYSPLSKPDPIATYVGNPNGSGTGTLVPLGAHYIKFSDGSDFIADSDYVIMLYDASSDWTVAGDSSQWISIEITGSLSLPNCTNGQNVVYQNDQLTCIDFDGNEVANCDLNLSYSDLVS